MDNMTYILFICIAVPLSLMTGLLEKKSKRTMIFVIIGCFIAMIGAEINGFLLNALAYDYRGYVVTVTPVTEELLKAIPVFYFALVFSDRIEDLLSVSIAVGIGFAILENAYVLVMNMEYVSVSWAIIRALGTGMMHGMCTLLVGVCFSYVRKKRKLFVVGSFAALSVSITYHSIFNMLVQSDYRYVGAALPIITYLPFLVWRHKNKKTIAEKNND